MTLIRNIFLGLLIGLLLAFGFDSLFLHLLARPRTDQILLLFFSTAAFGYLTFYLLSYHDEILHSLRGWKFSFDREPLVSFFREHAAGLVIALIFFAVYLFIGLKLNHANLDTVDNYLDADNTAWMARIAAPEGSSREMRGPHPFAYFIFRPLGWVLNLFTGDYGLSVNILNTFVGGLCVFLAWLLIYNATKNKVYASLIALLFGLSTAQSFFGSVVETYIFSAAALLGFFVLLQTKKDSIFPLVLMSVVTFGITLTNFVQTFIGFVVSNTQTLKVSKTFRVYFEEIIRYLGLALSIGVLLSLIHAAWFPSSKLFFIPSDAAAEETFAIDVFQDPQWKAVGRVMLLLRTILLYTVIAPKPYVFTSEVGGTFPRFNFFKIAPEEFSFSSYSGLGNALVLAWALLLLAAGVFFLWNLIRTRKLELPFTFALCVLFNFLLHLNYGYEPFLYSPDWAYALILFVGLSLAPLAKNRFFQGVLLLFLLALAYNQFEFFQFVFKTVAPFIGQGG
jgi:hypothetical protein